jgi:hypothetical protein
MKDEGTNHAYPPFNPSAFILYPLKEVNHESEPFHQTTILCPVDMSGFSLEALRLAVKMAGATNATLDLLHVIEDPLDELYLSALTQIDPVLFDSYKDEPKRHAKFRRTTEEQPRLAEQFCRDHVQR